jgi:hypothetical protein
MAGSNLISLCVAIKFLFNVQNTVQGTDCFFVNLVISLPLFRYCPFWLSELICSFFSVIYNFLYVYKFCYFKLILIMFSIEFLFPVKCVPYSITFFVFFMTDEYPRFCYTNIELFQ